MVQPREAYTKRVEANGQLLLVLTGTITPAPGTAVARKDPVLRRSDYFQSFTYWLNHPDPRLRRLLFVENSGADLTDFQQALRKAKNASNWKKDVEIISISPNPPPPEMHYGYSELQMLDQALSLSRLVRTSIYMIKITGRLIFPALPKLLDKLPENPRLVVDARARLPFRPTEQGMISTQLFLSRLDFYDEHLRNSYLSLAKTFHYPYFIEHLFYEKLACLKGEDGILLRFPINCEPVGFTGHSSKEYNSPSRRVISTLRAVCRVIAPNFWL